jgi:hypothetical protein
MRRVRAHLSYANVMATIAVFIALGGTSYAALGRNSVGERQIRPKAVGTSELKSRAVSSSKIRPGAVTASRLSTSARNTLRGPAGPQGRPGPAGPQGANGITYRALIEASGAPVGGNTSGASDSPADGVYRFGFDRSIAGCALTATLVKVGAVDPPAGRITAAEDGGRVVVRTYDAAGAATDLPFHFIAAC